MFIYIKLAWRNIFRNKRRTFIAGLAIGIGLAALIYTDALIKGMEKNMIDSATSSFMGEGQIHAEGFREEYDVDKTVHDAAAVIDSLKADPKVKNYAPRVMTLSMATSPANVSAVTMVGIDPKLEKNLSEIDDVMQEGAYLDGDNPHDIIIGSKLAEILEVGMGDRLVLTASEAETGNLSQDLFRVSGIYHFNVRELDRSFAFIRIDKAQEMLGLGNRIHEIALDLNNPQIARDNNNPFWKKYSTDGNEAIGWVKILPSLDMAFKLSEFSTFIVAIILFGVIALGIINTLFMSLHERMFEFGVLRAVGTRPFAMGRLIMFEAGSLAIISIILGMILGYIVTYIYTKIGIDYRGIEFAGATIRSMLYPILTVGQFIKYPFWVFVFTTLIALYPARYAAKMKPAEAMRKSF